MSRTFAPAVHHSHSLGVDMTNVEEDIDFDMDNDEDDDTAAWSRREAARLKQIQIGKARPEYQRYVREVPPSRRRPSQPSTPDPRARVSKRQFDRALGDWRRRLHEFDAVPRNPPRQAMGAEHEAWSESGRSVWGGASKRAGVGGYASYEPHQSSDRDTLGSGHEAMSRSGYRRSRGIVAPRGERSFGKFGPRKSALCEDDELDVKESQTPALPPAPPPFSQPTELAPQQCAVRISLADQLMEMQYSAPMTAPSCNSWPWYEEVPWSNVETPQKPLDMNYMAMEPMETPDKQAMVSHGMLPYPDYNIYKACDDYMTMPSESSMIPHRLFDSSPEKYEVHSTHSETTTIASTESLPSPCKVDAPLSPGRPSKQREMMSPMVNYLRSPVPSTPKRPNYVPETPSPDRMHCSWIHPTMNFTQAAYSQAPMPWTLGMQAPHEQSIPEFLQSMYYSDAEPKCYSSV